jgi:hypothetical protein
MHVASLSKLLLQFVAPGGHSVSRELLIVLTSLVTLLLGSCTYIASATAPSPDDESAVTQPTRTIPGPIAHRDDTPPPQRLRVLSLNETATLPGRTSESSPGTPLFDVTALGYELAESYENPIGGVERPPQGAKILFVLMRATNVSQFRGRPPTITAAQGTTNLRGCPIALGNRETYGVMREVFPEETIKGWLCRVVPASAQADEINVTAGRLSRVSWRLVHLAKGAP